MRKPILNRPLFFRKVLRAPNRKVHRAVVKTNPLKNVRTMLQLNPYAAVMKKTAELNLAKQRALKEAKSSKKPVANPLAKRAAAVAKKGGKRTKKIAKK